MSTDRITVAPDSLDVLDRGSWVHADTQGEAVRFAVARAAFLDCLLRDEDVIGEVVEHLNELTGADSIVEALRANFKLINAIGEEHSVFTPDGHLGEHTWDDLPSGVRSRVNELSDQGMDMSRQLFAIVLGEDEDQTRSMLERVVAWTRARRIDWPWLVSDIVMWYRDKVMYLNPHGGWYGTVRKEPDEWEFHPIEDIAQTPRLAVRRRKAESFEAYRRRARQACSDFLQSLDDEWPRGRVPTDGSSVERNVTWFYEHRLKGASKASLAAECFGSAYLHLPAADRARFIDGRRKDIRDGIRDAEQILSSSGVAFGEESSPRHGS